MMVSRDHGGDECARDVRRVQRCGTMDEPMRVAWFSPLPPNPSGIAAYTGEIVPRLTPRFGAVDLYCAPFAGAASGALNPTEFTWRHRRQPYDLVVYQLGNSRAHDFIWSFLFRYPGLVVLHDAQLHQARALWLLSRLHPRLPDYLAEVRANHPEASPDVGHLFAAGLGGDLYHLWPLVSLVLRRSRLTAVHNAHLAGRLAATHPHAAITALPMGTADPRDARPSLSTETAALRQQLRIPESAVVVGAYGGITPEKRIPQLLHAVAALGEAVLLHVLLVGQRAAHYDVDADIERLGLGGRVHIAGFVPDEALPAHLALADICWCLRWPSNGETSASWIRCLAAGRPTLITALAQLQDVPVIDAEQMAAADLTTAAQAIGVALDPLDEPRHAPQALAALVNRPDLRGAMGAQARRYWESRHTLQQMADAYERLILEAASRPAPDIPLPAHLLDDGETTMNRILSETGAGELLW
jgi:glycosyltransferase involved in cell wall biosynthesis